MKLHRKFLEWEWYHKSEMVHLFLHILLRANHSDGNWQGISIKRGQFITGLRTLNKDTGISIQTIRTCLSKLQKTGEINRVSNNQYSIITVLEYDSYQLKEIIPNNQINKQPTSNQQATNKQPTTNKNIKEGKELKKGKKCLLRNSGIGVNDIKKEFSDKKDIQNADPEFYYNAALDWSDGKNEMRTDWVAVIRGFARRDLGNGKLRLAQRSQLTKEEKLDKLREMQNGNNRGNVHKGY